MVLIIYLDNIGAYCEEYSHNINKKNVKNITNKVANINIFAAERALA